MNNPLQEILGAFLLAMLAYLFIVFLFLEGGPH